MKLPVFAMLLGSGLLAQEPAGLTARELYFNLEASAALAQPQPQPKPGPPARASAPRRPAAPSRPVVKAAPPPEPLASAPAPAPAAPSATPSGVPVIQAAAHLGVRYNVLQVLDRETKRREPVDPDRSFRAGDCVSIELEPNRAGFLYVFNLGSTGAWQPLLPSPDMPDQRNRVMNGRPLLVPDEHCFEFDNHAGTERLLLVITEQEEDMRRLGEAIRRPEADPAAGPRLLAGGRLVQELAEMRQGQMIGRDIKIAKVGRPQAEGERPNSVYAVRTAASSGGRLVIEIALRHE